MSDRPTGTIGVKIDVLVTFTERLARKVDEIGKRLDVLEKDIQDLQ